ncbi:MAG TPA: sigma-70 family RNA polymerase sigma factor [Chthoniobacterales bacterium]
MTLDHSALMEDPQIMAALVKHEPSAIECLYLRYKSFLKSIIMQVVHDECEADDVIQDVLIQVWNRPQTYSSEKGKLGSWLATLARRRAMDRIRKHCAYRRATDRYEVACNHPDKAVSEIHVVEAEADANDLKQLLEHYLETLPPSQQEVIRLAYFQSRSQREISLLTHTPLGTVKTRIELGIKKLTHAMGGSKRKIA